MTTVWHLEVHPQDMPDLRQDFYYTSLTALVLDNEEYVTVSKFTLDRHDWSKPYTVEGFWTIRKGKAASAAEVRRYYGIEKPT